MDIIDKARLFEQRKWNKLTTSDRIVASREAKSLILGLNELYKQNEDSALMELMKRLTVLKKKLEKRLKGRPEI
ncbi:hypothetical protein [uncultured Eudoraea sp.]|jgi:hypothetical protein|uniref:hypothetical protein n=1 Tax=uncultured Eudoraea sp. TaxID=1035614 RepID=UPI0017FBCD36|nr:hypothetical protein [uncultured Eudoraea sp.]MBT8180789.1 hypothetical protein [Eudoraea sp.]MBT8291950.1 hypothetical protein [Eudoraea sp.]NNL01516.1 hypothetical protein [Eudoraea sp.]